MVAAGGESGGEQGAGAALALGARDVEGDGAEVGVVKAAEEFTDAVEVPTAGCDGGVGVFGAGWVRGRDGALTVGHVEEPGDGGGVIHVLSIGVDWRSATMG